MLGDRCADDDGVFGVYFVHDSGGWGRSLPSVEMTLLGEVEMTLLGEVEMTLLGEVGMTLLGQVGMTEFEKGRDRALGDFRNCPILSGGIITE